MRRVHSSRDGAVLIERGNPDLQHVLPPRPRCVAISCWRVGPYFSAMTFMAEQEMRRVFDVKDRTGGLNTDQLNGRNLHPWLAPLPLRPPDAGCAAVVRDKRVPLPNTHVAIPRHDIAQAVTNIERTARFEGARRGPTQIVSAQGTPVMYGDLIVAADNRGKATRR